MTNKMPKTGRLILTPMLNPAGKLIGDFTIAKAADECFYMWGSSQAQKYHMRWFEQHLPRMARCRSTAMTWASSACRSPGPKSRDVLQQLVDEDVSNAAFKFMDHRSMEVAHCPALINRVTYTGDLGYEIWVAPEYQRRLYQEIMRAGEAHGIVNFGMRALLCHAAREELPHLVPRAPPDLRRLRGRHGPLHRPRPRTTSSAARRRWRKSARAASCAACP